MAGQGAGNLCQSRGESCSRISYSPTGLTSLGVRNPGSATMTRLCLLRPPSTLNRSPKRCGKPDWFASPVESHIPYANNMCCHTVSYYYNVSVALKIEPIIVSVLFDKNVDIKKIEPLISP